LRVVSAELHPAPTPNTVGIRPLEFYECLDLPAELLFAPALSLGRLSQSAALFRDSKSLAEAHPGRTAALRRSEKFRLGLQPVFCVPTNKVARQFPKLRGPFGYFVVADFAPVLIMIFFIQPCVHLHKFVDSIVSVNCFFQVGTALVDAFRQERIIQAGARMI
jgi:hypothetical protein